MEIGIIGTGAMGRLYATEFAKAGYSVNACDLPEKRSEIEKALAGTGINVLADGREVSGRSDIIFYLVPVEDIGSAASEYGPATRKNAIVSSGTSVMTPAVMAFDEYLPEGTDVVNWHWMFGSSLDPRGQNTALVNHRSSKEGYGRARETFGKIGTNIIELPSYQEHDRITADTQAVTHLGLLSMLTAWKERGTFPWENPSYVGGIDNMKILSGLRVLNGKSHVFACLAIFNPYAKEQISQYAKSETELFEMRLKREEQQFRDRIESGGEFVFGNGNEPILLDDMVMVEFGLGVIPLEMRKPNSHSSLLSMVDAWHQLGINPYHNLICQTPQFRLRLGIVEYLFRNRELLEESIDTALNDREMLLGDDLAFNIAVRGWNDLVQRDNLGGYKSKFTGLQGFFEPRLEEANKRFVELNRRLKAGGR